MQSRGRDAIEHDVEQQTGAVDGARDRPCRLVRCARRETGARPQDRRARRSSRRVRRRSLRCRYASRSSAAAGPRPPGRRAACRRRCRCGRSGRRGPARASTLVVGQRDARAAAELAVRADLAELGSLTQNDCAVQLQRRVHSVLPSKRTAPGGAGAWKQCYFGLGGFFSRCDGAMCNVLAFSRGCLQGAVRCADARHAQAAIPTSTATMIPCSTHVCQLRSKSKLRSRASAAS